MSKGNQQITPILPEDVRKGMSLVLNRSYHDLWITVWDCRNFEFDFIVENGGWEGTFIYPDNKILCHYTGDYHPVTEIEQVFNPNSKTTKEDLKEEEEEVPF